MSVLARLFPPRTNYRGRPVVAWLGVALLLALIAQAGVISLEALLGRGDLAAWRRRFVWIIVGVAITSAAGLYDDVRPNRTRGLVRQIALLLKGRVTSGIVKLVAISSASALTTWMLGSRGWTWVVGTAVVAGASNLWNLLDVVPGRALKCFLPAVAGLAAGVGAADYWSLAAMALAAGAVLLALDLFEIGMLGDAGSNVLGFIVGIGLLEALSTAWLAIALTAILGLHVLAETVTLSRIIEGTAPLRWLDRLGRSKQPSEQGKQDRSEHSSST